MVNAYGSRCRVDGASRRVDGLLGREPVDEVVKPFRMRVQVEDDGDDETHLLRVLDCVPGATLVDSQGVFIFIVSSLRVCRVTRSQIERGAQGLLHLGSDTAGKPPDPLHETPPVDGTNLVGQDS